MATTMTPLGRQVLLVREPTEQVKGSLVVIEKEALASWYRVRAIGPEVVVCKPGERVLASSMAGQDIELDEPCVLMSESGILATEAE